MKPKLLHDWPKRLSEAVKIQREVILPQIDLYGTIEPEGLVLGIECAFNDATRKVYCAATLLRYPGFTEVERSLVESESPFPHNLEFEAFRQGKVICQALETIQGKPDLIIIHGDGINSPSGAGVATHIGMIFDVPTIGCFRRFRTGLRPKVAREKGSVSKISNAGREVAAALRSKDGVKPIYISPGYKVNLNDSVKTIQSMLRGFRAPEPIRVPHLLVMRYKASAEREALDIHIT